MRKIILGMLVFLATSSLNAFATNYCTATFGAQACYLFTEGSGTTDADVSGNSNTLTFNSSGHPSWSSSVPARSYLSFSASLAAATDFMKLTSNIFTAPSARTIVAWVNVSNPQPSTNGGRIFDDRVNTGFVIDVQTSNLIRLLNTGTSNINVVTSTAFTTSTWTHIAITWDGTTNANNVHIYINGTEASYGTRSSGNVLANPDGNDQVNNSGGANAGISFFLGNITEMGIFNQVFSQSQIQDEMTNGLLQNTPASSNTTITGATINGATIN